MNAGWIYPSIAIGSALQAFGAPMGGQLKTTGKNPWLASAISFGLVTPRS